MIIFKAPTYYLIINLALEKNYSTTFLYPDMFDNIFDNKSKGNTAAITFLEIKKDFDKVDHDILIEKLKSYCIDGTVILWFKYYLEGRKHCTKIYALRYKYLFECYMWGT